MSKERLDHSTASYRVRAVGGQKELHPLDRVFLRRLHSDLSHSGTAKRAGTTQVSRHTVVARYLLSFESCDASC